MFGMCGHPPRLCGWENPTEMRSLLLVAGQAPFDLAPQLAGASLHALPKPGGDVSRGRVRAPLGIKVLCAAVKDPNTSYFALLGVAVPHGTKAAVFVGLTGQVSNPSQCFLTVDSANRDGARCGSTCRGSRRTPRRRVVLRAPFQALLRRPPTAASQAGVQHGDALGSLPFSFAL